MTRELLEKKQLILIKYLQNIVSGYTTDKWKIKAEYSTNDNDSSSRVIVVQEQSGQKQVFYGDILPMYNYYMIDIYGLTIKECKELSLLIGNLIGKSERIEVENNGKLERWQIIFTQYVNPQAIEYMDIRRVGYNATLKCIVNKIYEKDL